jgi:23S rRNA pseudouridine1911/1915/1917 synthase
METLFSLKVSEAAEPVPIAKLLKAHGFSRSLLRRVKAADALYKNGQQARLIDPALPGDEIIVAQLPQESRIIPQSADLELIYEDEHILVVNKPPGLLIHPLSKEGTGTLANFLAGYLNGSRFHIVGRLDRGTSGLVLVAKDPLTAAKLFKERQKALWTPQYLAFVKGKLTGDGQIDLPLGRVEGKRWVSLEGKPALTRYRSLLFSDEASLVNVQLITGRTNQIRIHFAACGHPLLGENIYAADTTLSRPALHAWRLQLPNLPEFVAPLPEDLLKLKDAFWPQEEIPEH